MKKIKLLDCTLRDGAYINHSLFGKETIKGIINRLQSAKVDIVECGWLKNDPYQDGSTYYHSPEDARQYVESLKNGSKTAFTAMIDYNRYDLANLPDNNRKSLDAIRVVFPKDKVDEGMNLAAPIRDKGYNVMFQAANTLGYSDKDLIDLIEKVNRVKPASISVVDTFGAMYGEDLIRILSLFDHNLDPEIVLGFHSHNNLQMSFALAIQFVETLQSSKRELIVDSSLCGMGRGAGNANTELVANYLNKKHHGDYDLNVILDTIDIYMSHLQSKHTWGYSTPYFVAGNYCAHVNNIVYLQHNHKTRARDLKNVIEMLDADTRRIYDYDNLEKVYSEYISREVDDTEAKRALQDAVNDKMVVLIAPGKSSKTEMGRIKKYIEEEKPIVIGINAILPEYVYDYVFFSNAIRYDYAREAREEQFSRVKKIVTSNISTRGGEGTYILNYNDLAKRGWKYYDNSTFLCLRLLDMVSAREISIAGFDGFEGGGDYSDSVLDAGVSKEERRQMNNDIKAMLDDFIAMTGSHLRLRFITKTSLLAGE